jgi:hypothetical protein
MRKTSVSAPVAIFSQAMLDEGFSAASLPVMKATVDATFLWVTGIPAYAGAAIAEVTPGTISKGIPRFDRYSASSPPRPKMKGSPPLSRQTIFPSAAPFASRRLIPSCGSVWAPPTLPT